jgi:hypothetical protein
MEEFLNCTYPANPVIWKTPSHEDTKIEDKFSHQIIDRTLSLSLRAFAPLCCIFLGNSHIASRIIPQLGEVSHKRAKLESHEVAEYYSPGRSGSGGLG